MCPEEKGPRKKSPKDDRGERSVKRHRDRNGITGRRADRREDRPTNAAFKTVEHGREQPD